MSSRKTNDIKALSERLESLQITEEASSDYKQTDMEDSSTVTEQNSKTSGGVLDYFSRVTGS